LNDGKGIAAAFNANDGAATDAVITHFFVVDGTGGKA